MGPASAPSAASARWIPSTVRNRALAAWKPANDRGDGESPLQPIGLQEARHTCASVLIASGANPKVIQKVMGHATIGMTCDQYGHLMPGGLEEAAGCGQSIRRVGLGLIGRLPTLKIAPADVAIGGAP